VRDTTLESGLLAEDTCTPKTMLLNDLLYPALSDSSLDVARYFDPSEIRGRRLRSSCSHRTSEQLEEGVADWGRS